MTTPASPETTAPATPAQEAPASPAPSLREAISTQREAPAQPEAQPTVVVDETGRHHDPMSGKFIPKEGEAGYVAPRRQEGEGGEGREAEAEAPSGAEAPAGAEGEAEGVEEGGGDDPLTVELPGRRAGETVAITAPDPETAEHLRRLSNMAMTGEEVRSMRQAVEQNQLALDQTVELLQTDPVGFALQHMPEEMQDEIALQMLANPAVLERVAPVLERLLDDGQREIISAKLQLRRQEVQGRLSEARQERVQATQNANEIREVVLSMVPDGYSPEETGQFMRQCLTDISAFAEVNRLRRVDPKSVPALLAGRLTELGLNPVEAAARAANRRLSGTGTGSARPAVPPKATGPKRVTAQTFINGQKTRQAVAATTPAGAGLPPISVNAPPPGATLKEASAHLRAQLRR